MKSRGFLSTVFKSHQKNALIYLSGLLSLYPNSLLQLAVSMESTSHNSPAAHSPVFRSTSLFKMLLMPGTAFTHSHPYQNPFLRFTHHLLCEAFAHSLHPKTLTISYGAPSYLGPYPSTISRLIDHHFSSCDDFTNC